MVLTTHIQIVRSMPVRIQNRKILQLSLGPVVCQNTGLDKQISTLLFFMPHVYIVLNFLECFYISS